MARKEEILKEAELCASANTQIIGDWGEHYLGFIHGAEWADDHPHWISVEDEMPPKDKAYLAYWQHLGVTKYRYVKAGAKVSRTFSEHITHWMPLPQAPSSSEKPNNCDKGGEE